MLLFLLILCVIYVPVFQKSITNHFLNEKIIGKTCGEIKYSKLYLSPSLELNVDDLALLDCNKDTIALIKTILVDINLSNLNTGEIKLDNLVVNTPNFYYKIDELGSSNIDWLIDLFPVTESKNDFRLKVEDYKIVKGTFSVNDFRNARISDTNLIDYNHLEFTKFNLCGNDLLIHNSNIKTTLDSLSFSEQSGFTLSKLSGELAFSNSQIELKSGKIKTLKSNINIDLKYTFDSLANFADFNHKVHTHYSFKPSVVYCKDITYFTTSLKGFNEIFEFSANVDGYTDNLSGKNVVLKWKKHTLISTDFNFYNLVENNRKLKFKFHSIQSTFKELKTFPMYPFTENKRIPMSFIDFNSVSEELIFLNGDLLVKSDEIDAHFNLSQVNQLQGSVDLTIDIESDILITGNVSASKIPLYYIKDIPKDIFNNASGHFSFITPDSASSNMELDIKGDLYSLDIYNENLSDISIDGKIVGKSFNGKINSKDSSIIFDYNGLVDFNNNKPIYDFFLNLKRIRFHEFQQTNINQIPLLDLSLNLNFKTNFENEVIHETIFLDSLFVETLDSNTVDLGSGSYQSSFNNIIHQTSINLESEILKVTLNGQFDFKSIINSFKNYGKEILEDEKMNVELDSNLVFNYEIKISNGEKIRQLSSNYLIISDSTVFKGFVNGVKGEEEMYLVSDSLGYNHLLIDSLFFTLNKNNSQLDFNFRASSFIANKNNNIAPLKNVNVLANFKDDVAKFYLDWFNDDKYNGNIHLNAKINDFSNYSIRLDSSEINLGDFNWTIHPKSIFKYENKNLFFKDFEISTVGDQEIQLNGAFYDDKNLNKDTLLMKFNKINLSQFNNLLSTTTRLDGFFTGELITDNLFFPKESSAYSIKANIDSFSLNKRSVGNIQLLSFWDYQRDVFSVSGNAEHNLFNSVLYYGTIDIYDNINQLNIKSTLRDFDISIISPYLSEELLLHKANLFGDLDITGKLSSPILNGDLTLNDGVFEISKFKVPYRFSGGLSFSQNKIFWKKLILLDDDDNVAYCSGELQHNGFQNFNLDLNIKANYLKLFNNTKKEFNYFYGLGYVSADINLKTKDEKFILSGDLATAKNSKITMPIDYADDITRANFITFIDEDTRFTDAKPVRNIVEDNTFLIDLDIDVTPDAKVDLIYDEQTNERIKGTASGSLTIKFNKSSEFLLFGTLKVVSGDFMFSFQNFINKKFEIQPGGTISWDGDVLNGEIKLTSIYKIKTSLKELSPYFSTSDDDIPDVYKQSATVQCLLTLSQSLLQPDIKFDIGFENPSLIDPEVKSSLDALISTEQDLNLQFFSLLMLNKFWPKFTSDESSGFVSSTSSELLSNQLSNWLSGISDEVDFNVKYQPSSTGTEEFQFGFETEVLDDRLIIKGTAGYASSETNPSVQQQNIIGDFILEYKISEDGSFRVKAFNLTDEYNSISSINNSPYIQGVGLYYQEGFDNVGDLKIVKGIKKWFKVSSKK